MTRTKSREHSECLKCPIARTKGKRKDGGSSSMTPQSSKQINAESGTFCRTSDGVFASREQGIKSKGLVQSEEDTLPITTKCNSWILFAS